VILLVSATRKKVAVTRTITAVRPGQRHAPDLGSRAATRLGDTPESPTTRAR